MRGSPVVKEASRNSVRTTIILTEAIDRNLEVLAALTGRGKGEVIREALSAYLQGHGLKPEKLPILEADNGSGRG